MNKSIKTFIILVISIGFVQCEKVDSKENIATNLLKENINILLDSLDTFNYAQNKNLTVGLLDSINEFNQDNYSVPKAECMILLMEKSILANLKSKYKVNLVKRDYQTTDLLFVCFSNFYINDTIDQAQITVKKRLGIGMLQHIYYFKKTKNLWKFQKKIQIGMG